jgi:hypothetical protein
MQISSKSEQSSVRINRVSTEMSLHVLAHNFKRLLNIMGPAALLDAIRAWGLFCVFKSRCLVRARRFNDANNGMPDKPLDYLEAEIKPLYRLLFSADAQ